MELGRERIRSCATWINAKGPHAWCEPGVTELDDVASTTPPGRLGMSVTHTLPRRESPHDGLSRPRAVVHRIITSRRPGTVIFTAGDQLGGHHDRSS